MKTLILLAVLLVGLMVSACAGPSASMPAPTATPTLIPTIDPERRAGKHCLDGSGVHVEFFTLVQINLRDPDSLKMSTTNTRIGPLIDGRHRIVMDFNARNGFGGMDRGTATGWIDHISCTAEIETIE